VGAALALAPLAGTRRRIRTSSDRSPRSSLAGFALFWVTGFDIIYATLDEAFDREHGVQSLVAWLGRAERAARVVGAARGAMGFLGVLRGA
jgi:4-hydroxybenzoate polyprenyltransferase